MFSLRYNAKLLQNIMYMITLHFLLLDTHTCGLQGFAAHFIFFVFLFRFFHDILL